jgi:hypothetical protein
MGILSYMTAFGLAAGAGSRACMVILALGVFHYTPYFELSESYAWVASIPVMFVVAFLALLDILADAFPDISELNDVAQYLPGLVAGFLCFAAMTGSVDNNLLHLVISGVLGGGVATGARFVRNELSEVSRDIAGELSIKTPHMTRSVAETMGTAVAIPAAMVFPILVVGFVGLGFAGIYFGKRKYEAYKMKQIADRAAKNKQASESQDPDSQASNSDETVESSADVSSTVES